MIAKNNVLNFQTRKKIYEFVRDSPGLNVNEISRRTEIPFTTLIYHLRILERQELVEFRFKGKYKLVYTKSELGVQDKELLELLRKKIPCRILLHMFNSRVCSQIELSQELDIHPSLASYHLKKMVKMGIIEVAPVENDSIYLHSKPDYPRVMRKTPRGREIFYRRKSQELFATIGRIMIAHKDSLANAQYIDEFFSHYRTMVDMGLTKKNKLKNKKNAEKKVVERNGKKVAYFKVLTEEDFYDFFYEVFRPPFCA